MSHVIKEVAGVLGITLKHATTKHAQTIGLLERSRASIKQALKIETCEWRSLWFKYVSIAVLKNNTYYLASFCSEPSRVFQGRTPYDVSDLKMMIRPRQVLAPDSQIAQDVLEQTEMIFQVLCKMPCKLLSHTKRNMKKNQCLQSLGNQITFTLYI